MKVGGRKDIALFGPLLLFPTLSGVSISKKLHMASDGFDVESSVCLFRSLVSPHTQVYHVQAASQREVCLLSTNVIFTGPLLDSDLGPTLCHHGINMQH